ncbi:MAG TPA: DNRLRE domain-containing protein [Sphingobacteriaceae bacterium]
MKKLNHFSIKKMLYTTGIRMYASALMKKTLLLVFAAILFTNCKKNAGEENGISNTDLKTGKSSVSVTPGHYTFATFNIRQDVPDPGTRAWTVRRPLVKDMIIKYSFDLFGVQEAKGNQITNLLSDLSGFAKIGTGRDGNSTSEHSAIFYKTAKFTVLSSGTFWLSPGAPTTPTGPSWDADYKRICTWGKFQDKATTQIFWVFNSHFDHQGATARQESANLILNQIAAKAGSWPVIFMGDLNCNQTSGPFVTLNNSALLQETWDLAPIKTPALRVTYNGWDPTPSGDQQIDHIFVTSTWSVAKRAVLWDNYDNINGYNDVLPSDHFPVIADVKMPDPVTTVLTPTDDAHVRDGDYYEDNYGSEPVLTIKSGAVDFSRKAFFKFDLSSIPNTVTSAKLRVYGRNIESTANVDIKSYYADTDNWTEDFITWDNCPIAYSIGATPVNNTLKYYEWNVTSRVQSEVAGDNIVSLVLHQTAGGNLTTTWDSKEGVNKPELVIIH